MEKRDHEKYMKKAIELSRRAAIIEKSGGVFGAVVVNPQGEIIGEGYNQVSKTHDPRWHAEMQAIGEACKKMGTPHLDGCDLYTSAECCPMCLATAYWAHIRHIYFASTTEDSLKYGNFADIGILEQICKPHEEQQIKATQMMQKEAVEVWKEFASMPDKVHY
ncbi:MAG: nucleoside deaminase [Parachlamydiaceae bacterium]|nr:nucleoside deaminase [Parachlamydiaceae bacterium]